MLINHNTTLGLDSTYRLLWRHA